jgi:hypothetical protein
MKILEQVIAFDPALAAPIIGSYVLNAIELPIGHDGDQSNVAPATNAAAEIHE